MIEIRSGETSYFCVGPKAERDEAWRRFNELRDEANRRANEEREKFRFNSERLRGVILSACSGLTWSSVTDTLFFFDKTTVEQVKKWQQYLAKAMKMLSEYKAEMLPEHKQECFEKFQEIRESHEGFWRQYKGAHEAKVVEHRRRRDEIVARIKGNIEKNEQKLREASEALGRQRERAAELREKLSETTSRKWQGIYETWIDEAETKIEDIQSSVRRIEEWIGEDNRRLREFDD
jgi:hypothetical protein